MSDDETTLAEGELSSKVVPSLFAL
jgi:hypothetical protein